jgi:hypothetical protein
MKYILLPFIALFVGCSSTPTIPKFPDVPTEFLQHCLQLKSVDINDPSIVTLSRTIVKNYATHHQCSNKVDAWIEWYNKQKKISED